MPKVKWKAATLLGPLPPVLVSCGTAEQPNVFTAAWCGIVCSDPAMTYVSVRPERHSHGLIAQSGEFVINLPTRALIHAVDWCGVKSGRDVDKFAACGLTALPGYEVAVPHLEQSPICLECRVSQTLRLGSHDMFLANILATVADEALIDDKGRLALEEANLAAFAHGEYFALGEKLGSLGYTVRKKA